MAQQVTSGALKRRREGEKERDHGESETRQWKRDLNQR